jgi:hypothetical protein
MDGFAFNFGCEFPCVLQAPEVAAVSGTVTASTFLLIHHNPQHTQVAFYASMYNSRHVLKYIRHLAEFFGDSHYFELCPWCETSLIFFYFALFQIRLKCYRTVIEFNIGICIKIYRAN